MKFPQFDGARRVGAFAAAAFAVLTVSAQGAGRFIISELHYNPSGIGPDVSDWLEVKNVGDAPLSTAGYTFGSIGGVTLPATVVPPGGMIVLARDDQPLAFKALYGFNPDGTFNGGLSSTEESIEIINPSGVEVFSVQYWDGNDPTDPSEEERDDWPQSPDGDGYTLTLFDSSKAPEDPDNFRNWRPSIELHGSPKADEPMPAQTPTVYVNEVRSRDGVADNDYVELFNSGPSAVDVSDWFLSDTLNNPKKINLPPGSVVPAGGFLVFENGIGTIVLSLSSKDGERAFLYSADAGGNLTGYVNGFHFGPSGDGLTFSRHVDSQGRERPVTTLPTRGAANGPPVVGPLVISEIMYDPGAQGGDEFLEIKNISGAAVPLYNPSSTATNWRIEGVSFVLNGAQPTLAAGEVALVVPIAPETFRVAHGVAAGVQIFGPYETGVDPPSFRDGGERIALQRPDTNEGVQVFVDMDVVEYSDEDPWPDDAGGDGNSLVRIDDAAFGGDPANWEASAELGGTPGDAVSYTGPEIYINEILAHTDLPQTDAIELFNPNVTAVDIGGWYLSDSRNTPKKFRIPDGTMIAAGGYWVVNGDNDDNSNSPAPAGYYGTSGGFALSENGESAVLSSADAAGNLTGYQDRVTFEGTDNGVSVGRVVDFQDRVDFVPMDTITFTINRLIPNPPGAVNSPPKIGPVVISEIYYDPANGDVGFIELTNITGATVVLFDNSPGGDSSNNWLFSDGIEFTFPGVNPTLPAGGIAVILPIGVDVAAFRTANNVPPSVPVIGGADGFSGSLNNGGETVILAKQAHPNADEGGLVPIVPVDYVDYDNDAPWPVVGPQGGLSIERIALDSYGSDANNWKASNAPGGSPGAANSTGFTYAAWAQGVFSEAELNTPGLTGPGDDINDDGFPNLLAYGYAFDPKAPIDPTLLPQLVIGSDGGGDYLAISFRMRTDATDLDYMAQISEDLTTWTETTMQVSGAVPNPDGTVTVTFRDPDSIDATPPQGFLRGKVILQ